MQVTDAVLECLQASSEPRSVLIAGSGPEGSPDWQAQGYTVIRLDIEPRNEPDICASMTSLGDIGPYDVVCCSHALEHLYPHEVFLALSEFRRVLKPDGVVVIVVPDLEDVRPTEEVLLEYPGWKISGLHLYYGDPSQISEFPHMAHHSGFVQATLRGALQAAGFEKIRTERLAQYNLMGTGVKP
jgi:SAM-dependent methyltransferase